MSILLLLRGTAVVTPPPPPGTVIRADLQVDEIWTPLHVGNGRLLIAGQVITAGAYDRMEYKLDTAEEVGVWTSGYIFPTDFTGHWEFWISGLRKGSPYSLSLRAFNNTLPDYDNLIVEEDFIWHLEVHPTEERFLGLYIPDLLSEDPLARGLYLVNARAMADIFAKAEDVVVQSIPHLATWGVRYWEDQLGLPFYSNLTLAQRRQTVVAQRYPRDTGARTAFFSLIEAVVGPGGYVVQETYATYVVHLSLSSNTSEILRALRVLIERIKPVGVQVIVDSGGFKLDISQLDIDTL